VITCARRDSTWGIGPTDPRPAAQTWLEEIRQGLGNVRAHQPHAIIDKRIDRHGLLSHAATVAGREGR